MGTHKIMTAQEIEKCFDKLPRFKRGFYPTPFHKMENLSADYGCNIYAKREDMSGPSNFGGNKVRKLELIMGKALAEGYDTLISMGAYQTNSAMEFCQFCRLANITPIVYLADIHDVGIPQKPDDVEGNMRLMRMMGVEMHFVAKDEGWTGSFMQPLWDKAYRVMAERKAELEAQGHKVWCIPSGCADDEAMPSYVLGFAEIMEQAAAAGIKLDYIYHTNGTSGSLPGLILGKYLMGSDVEIRSITCIYCDTEDPQIEGDFTPANGGGPGEIVRRVQYAAKLLGVEVPPEDWIRDQIHFDNNYYGEEYGEPTELATKTMLEVASREGFFTDSVYSGKGITGMLDHIRTGKAPQGSNICFIHTGGTGALFAEEGLTGKITGM